MKNPAIKEGGAAKVFNGIKRLYTRQSGSDEKIPWVPESERTLGTKYITQNGVYRAEDDGYYAYSSVTVSVPTDTGVTGEGEDGEQHTITPDPVTGELVDEIVPSSIAVTTPPAKTDYLDGEAIDFTGIVVTAYLASGEIWEDANHPGGIIPFGELSFPVTNADYSQASHVKHVTTEFDITPNPFDYGDVTKYDAWSVGGGAYRRSVLRYSLNGAVRARSGINYEEEILASASQGVSVTMDLDVYEVSASEAAGLTPEEIAKSDLGTFLYNNNSTNGLTSSYTYGDKTVYYYGGSRGISGYMDINPITSGSIDQIAWSMVYGEIDGAGKEDIPVLWFGPGGTLETSFPINVSPEQGSSGGGGSDITLDEVNQAITTSQLLGIDVVYIRGVEYTMGQALDLRRSLMG